MKPQSMLLTPGASRQDFVKIEGLFKKYGNVHALNGLDLSVQEGEVYGFLGRNGAGKSTAIRILMGITKQTKGTVTLLGRSLKEHQIELRQKIGYVAQEQNFYGWMTPKIIGEFVRGFYPTWDNNEYLRLVRVFDLPNKQKIRTFSGGMRVKLALSLALAHRPILLLLDEPTAGLDPVARREFIEMVKDQAENRGGTILFSSHLIDEVESAADCIGIIEKGRMVYQGALTVLSKSVRRLVHPLMQSGPPQIPPEITDNAFLEIIQDRILKGERHLVVINSGPPEVFDSMISGLNTWAVEKMSLENIFIELVRDPIKTVSVCNG